MKGLPLAVALAAFAATTAHAAVTELVLYKDNQFRGPSQTIKGEVANLENGMGREVSSLVARGGAWEVCTRDHFRGRCRVLPEGQYGNLGGLNDRIVSVRFLGTDARWSRDSGWEERREARDWHAAAERRDGGGDRWGRRGGIILYGQEGFAGRSLEIGEDVPDLSQRRFDDRASSLVVEHGLWQLCTEPNYRGRCRTFRRGDYRELRGFDDRISSVRRVE